jgi:Protein of unknown function (DUF4232)
LALVDVSGAGGRSYSTYRITNTSTARCTLIQPTVSFRASDQSTVKQAQLTGAAATLSLKPADSATFVVSDSSCTQPAAASQLVATIAGSPSGLALAGQYQLCAPTVTALVAS